MMSVGLSEGEDKEKPNASPLCCLVPCGTLPAICCVNLTNQRGKEVWGEQFGHLKARHGVQKLKSMAKDLPDEED